MVIGVNTLIWIKQARLPMRSFCTLGQATEYTFERRQAAAQHFAGAIRAQQIADERSISASRVGKKRSPDCPKSFTSSGKSI